MTTEEKIISISRLYFFHFKKYPKTGKLLKKELLKLVKQLKG